MLTVALHNHKWGCAFCKREAEISNLGSTDLFRGSTWSNKGLYEISEPLRTQMDVSICKMGQANQVDENTHFCIKFNGTHFESTNILPEYKGKLCCQKSMKVILFSLSIHVSFLFSLICEMSLWQLIHQSQWSLNLWCQHYTILEHQDHEHLVCQAASGSG